MLLAKCQNIYRNRTHINFLDILNGQKFTKKQHIEGIFIVMILELTKIILNLKMVLIHHHTIHFVIFVS